MKPRDYTTQALRGLGLSFLVALLFWLWYDAQPKHKIENGLRHGYIGGLTKAETEAFTEALHFVTNRTRRGGVSIALNKWGPNTSLRVLTITDAGSAEFNCGLGNAAYDPRLDAVLIHVDLVRAWLTPEFQVAELFSPRKSFFVFLLLHELGHKTKHDSARNTYGPNATAGKRQIEEEADQYAFDQMEGLAERPLVIGAEGHSALAEAWKLDTGSFYLFDFNLVPDTRAPGSAKEDPKAAERVAKELLERTAKLRAQPLEVRRDLFLLSLLHALPRAAMRGDSPYSSLHEDPEHPTLVDRFRVLLENYRTRTKELTYPRGPDGMWAARSEALAAVAEQIDVLDRMQSSPLAEITVPAPIASLTWKGPQLLILTSMGTVYEAAGSQLTRGSFRFPLTRVLLKPADAIIKPDGRDKWSTIQSEVWTDARGNVYSYTDSGVFKANNGYWERIHRGLFANLPILSLSQSSSSALMTIWTGDLLKITDSASLSKPVDSELIVLEDGEKFAARRSISDILSDLLSRVQSELTTFDVAAVNNNAVWLSLWSIDEKLLGLAAYDPRDLHFLHSIRIHSPRPIDKESSAITVGDNGTVVIAVSAESSIEPTAGVRLDPTEIYTLDSKGSLEKRGRILIPYSRIIALSPELPESLIQGVQFLDKDHLLVSSHSWSPNFVFTLTDGSSRPLFFPSTSLSAPSSNGLLAFVPLSGGEASLGTEPGGNYRCYVLASPDK